MLLTGAEIHRMVHAGRIAIEPFDERQLEENAYGCRLAGELLEYTSQPIDPHQELAVVRHHIPEEGFVLEPRRFYLGTTLERIGGINYASELYANLSTALCGLFIQTSAPLGHTGAVICWTLEMVVVQPLRIYANARIAKVCFWNNLGSERSYQGRYLGSSGAVPSRIILDSP